MKSLWLIRPLRQNLQIEIERFCSPGRAANSDHSFETGPLRRAGLDHGPGV